MEESVKVESIIIKMTSGKKVTLTIEEAKSLFTQLEQLFGVKDVVISALPTIIYRDHWPWPGYTPIWAADSKSVGVDLNQGMSLTFSSEPV